MLVMDDETKQELLANPLCLGWNTEIDIRTFLYFSQMFAQTGVMVSSTSGLNSGCEKAQFLRSYTEQLISHFMK